MSNQSRITDTLRNIYAQQVNVKTDKQIEEILVCKNIFVEELYEMVKEEFLKRQNKLS